MYYNLFREVFRCIKDFMFWFLFVLFALAFVITAVFQSTGGEGTDWARSGALARLSESEHIFPEAQTPQATSN